MVQRIFEDNFNSKCFNYKKIQINVEKTSIRVEEVYLFAVIHWSYTIPFLIG